MVKKENSPPSEVVVLSVQMKQVQETQKATNDELRGMREHMGKIETLIEKQADMSDVINKEKGEVRQLIAHNKKEATESIEKVKNEALAFMKEIAKNQEERIARTYQKIDNIEQRTRNIEDKILTYTTIAGTIGAIASFIASKIF